MPKRSTKKQDAMQNALALIRAVTESGQMRGESLLGSPALRKKLREANRKQAAKG